MRISSSSEWKWIRTVPPLPERRISTRVCNAFVSDSSAATVCTSFARPRPPAQPGDAMAKRDGR